MQPKRPFRKTRPAAPAKKPGKPPATGKAGPPRQEPPRERRPKTGPPPARRHRPAVSQEEREAPDSFARILRALVPEGRRPQDANGLTAPLVDLDYAEELKLKNEALAAFWQKHSLPGQPEPVFASPRPRRYRTTSKRRVAFRNGRCTLFFDEAASKGQKRAFLPSLLEPHEHAAIYQFLQQKLCEPPFHLVAGHLNYLIIRGTYAERAVVFNLDELNGPIVRKLKILAAHLQKLPIGVTSAAAYFDPSHSDYYLESRRPEGALQYKKLFGPELLMATFCEHRYRFHPTSFSQVNESMVEPMLELSRQMLAPAQDTNFLDLYCGYGLFSRHLAPFFRQAIGIDAEGPSIDAARENCKPGSGCSRVRFMAQRITSDLIENNLPEAKVPEAILLDPPRKGTAPEVIPALAGRHPVRVLHIFCAVDEIPAALEQWRAGGFTPRRIVPLDMFPGTANLEVLVLLEPGLPAA